MSANYIIRPTVCGMFGIYESRTGRYLGEVWGEEAAQARADSFNAAIIPAGKARCHYCRAFCEPGIPPLCPACKANDPYPH